MLKWLDPWLSKISAITPLFLSIYSFENMVKLAMVESFNKRLWHSNVTCVHKGTVNFQ